eukprot:11682831-Alexandrium_andersonii.AAC.1
MCIRDRRKDLVGAPAAWPRSRSVRCDGRACIPESRALSHSDGGHEQEGDPVSYTHLRAHETSAHL